MKFVLLILSFFFVKQLTAQLPTDFQKVDLVTGLSNSTNFSFAPDGRIFILDRYGEVLIYKQSTQSTVSAGTLSVFHELEDGLIGIAFDPNFTTNKYIYLHYSPLSTSVNRISRFQMNGDLIDMSSEIVLLELPTMRSAGINHSGGDMAFDSQGNLFIATGDNSIHSNYAAMNEVNQANSAEKASSNTNDLRGKILRITPQANGTYTVPSGNLFPNGTGGLPEIYVMGARNPYRIFIDKEHNDWLFWGDVGPDASAESSLGPEGLDEINLTKNAGNYGWPYFAGVDNDAYLNQYANPNFYYDPLAPVNISKWNTGVTNLPPAKPALLEFFHKSFFAGPRYSFDSTILDEQKLPIEFDDVFFYYDFNSSRIWGVTLDVNGNVLTNNQIAPSVFHTSQDGFIDMKIGPDGHLYILAYGAGCCPDNVGTGRLIRIDYTGVVTNSPPIVALEADVTSGSLPLTVNFSSVGTIDPNGDSPLTYTWDFTTDGTVDSALENPTFTYTTAGTYNAQLKVNDGNGGVGVKNITIYAGNTLTSFSFNSPPDGGFVDWNDNIDLNLAVTDNEDGSISGGGIDCSDVNIVPSLGHLNHFHDDLTLDACQQTITLDPSGHDVNGDMDIYYVLGVNYTDQGGLTSFDQITLHPKRMEAEFYDSESGVTVIDNTDSQEGGNEAIRVNNNGYISFTGRNLLNITSVKYRIAALTGGGTIEFRQDSPTGNLIATTSIPSTGNLETWIDLETTFTAPSGKNDLFFVFKNGSASQDIFDVNFIEFVGNGVSVDNSPPNIESFVALSSTQARINFDEYITQASAENLSNYAINNGITINSAMLQPNGSSVLITYDALSAGTTYTLTIQNVANEAGLTMASQVLSISLFDPIAINVGGEQESATPNNFDADQYATGGTVFTNTISIGNTTNDAIYQTERFGNFTYNIPVPESGEYDIRLHFAELYWGLPGGGSSGGVGTRVFNVTIEGNPVLTDFDILAEVSPATALQKELDNISITDGFATIAFTSVVEFPKVSAIEILSPNTFNANQNASITINSPTQGSQVNQPFDVAFAIKNWTIAEGDTHMHYYIDDVMVGPHYSYEPITIDGLSTGNHKVTVELFNTNHTGTGIIDEVTVNVTGAIACNNTPFPDQWGVKQLEASSLPYRSVYTFPEHDLDGDGLKDIVTGGWWYKNPGSVAGNWVRSDIGSTFKNVALVHDFDNDGDMDLLGTTGAYTGADLVWAQNNGSGTFTIFSNIPSGNTNYTEPFLAGIAGGVFQVGGSYQMAINWNGAESTGSPMQMLTPTANPTTGTWSLVNIPNAVSTGEDIQAGDIDQDNDLDLFQGTNWIRNNGASGWETISTGISYVTTPDRVQLADFDRDGDLDAVVGQLGLGAGTNPASFEFAWFEAPSDPTQAWTRRILDTDVHGSLSVTAKDIDFDGDKDIVVGEWRGQNRLIVFENKLCVDNTFEKRVIDAGDPAKEHHDGARVTDIDNDGDLDVISNGWADNYPRIYENTSAITSNQLPTVSLGSTSSTITLPVNNVTLTGSGTDSDGGTVDLQWTQESGPSTASLSGATTTSLAVNDLVEGIYVFRLTVTDDENKTAFDEVSVTVNPEVGNQLPTVSLGSISSTITLPVNSVTLTGSGTDLDGGSVDLQWTQESGPSTASLSGATTTSLAANNLVEGTYVFRLTVTDDENETAFDEVNVTVNPEVSTNFALRINTGGTATTYSGEAFIADQYSDTGVTLDRPQTGLPEPYQTFRFSRSQVMGYDIPVADGEYTVRLHFAELWFGATGGGSGGVGSRIFDVSIEGQLVEDNLDVFAAVGADAMLVRNHTVMVTGGVLNINFSSLPAVGGLRHPIINAIEVLGTESTTSPPTVNLSSSNTTITLPINNVTLTGSGTDPDGGTVDLQWTQESGPSTASLSGATTTSLAVNDLVEGIYVFRLTVTDDENKTAFDEVSVTVNPEVGNQLPTVSLGSISSTITLPVNSVTLTGSGTDLDGGSVDLQWTQESGPSTASLSGATTTSLAANNLVEGTYVFRLTVTDDENETAFDEVNVTVNPEVSTNFALRINTGGTATTYSGEAFIADQYSDTGVTLDRPQTGLPEPYQTFRFSRSQVMGYDIPVADGEYTVRLHFAELWFGATGGGSGGVGSRIFDVSIEGQLVEDNLDVFAAVGADAMLVRNHTVMVTGGVLNIDFSSLPAVGGLRHPIINAIEVLGTESTTSPPTVNLSSSNTTITLPVNSVTLTGSGTDPDGGTVDLQWTQESGPSTASLSGATTTSLAANNLVEGIYVFRLTVTDDENETAFDEVSVTVNPEVGNQLPMVSLGSISSTITLPVNSVTLTGSGTDPDGGSVDLQWTQESGPSTASLSGATTTSLAANNLVEGTYVFRLTVTDDENKTAFDEVSVTVNPEVSTNFALRINTGGTATTYLGEDFIADVYSNTGRTLDRPQTGLPEPYQTFRYSRSQVLGYDIPVADGEYTVRLHFAELWFGATGGGSGGVGSRIFDVSIEGQLVEDNLDVFAAVGADAMLVRNHTVMVTGGVLNIDFSSLPAVGGNRHPIINAIEIFGTSSSSTGNSLQSDSLGSSLEGRILNSDPILYPNPAKNYTVVSMNSTVEISQINIYDLTGRLIRSYGDMQWRRSNEGIELDLVDIENGIYMITVLPVEEESYRLKLVIMN